jgi:alpha-tubulin suppressor-like RCC1 family protein
VTTTGEAYCWGLNGSGELGDGTTINRDAPAPVAGGLRFELVKAGGAVFTTGSCGRSTSGIVYCWGFGGDGLLGNGGVQNSSVPVEVASQGPGRGAFPTP